MKRMIAACLLGAGLAGLGEALAAEPMEMREYPISVDFFCRMSLDEHTEELIRCAKQSAIQLVK